MLQFVKGEIQSADLVKYVLESGNVDTILHFAAQVRFAVRSNEQRNSEAFFASQLKNSQILAAVEVKWTFSREAEPVISTNNLSSCSIIMPGIPACVAVAVW